LLEQLDALGGDGLRIERRPPATRDIDSISAIAGAFFTALGNTAANTMMLKGVPVPVLNWHVTLALNLTNCALKAHIETLKNELAQRDALLVTERERADRAIADLSALAERLAAIAEERSRPWWCWRPLRLT
jgi:hypothetical protein